METKITLQENRNIKKERNPECKYNDFDENNDPIDPITHQTFDENKNYVLNDRCYDADSIRILLTTTNKDPYTRGEIPKSVYDDLGVEYPDTVDLSSQNMSYQQLLNIQFSMDIKYLDLHDNEITSLENINFPMNLETIDLSMNQLISLQDVIFSTNLYHLDLSHNRIVSLQDVIFPVNLRYLHLDDNRISSLENIILPENIEGIYLSHNKIKTIKNMTFPRNLISLDLSDNEIEVIENVRISDFLKNSNRFYLYDNPVTNKELFITYHIPHTFGGEIV